MLTKQDKAVLKALVEQELKEIQAKKSNVVNSPVLSSIYRMKKTNIAFLEKKAEYQKFLVELSKKL